MKYKREITFDLSTEELKKEFGEGNYTKGYKLIREILKDYKFEHRQNSVYCTFRVTSSVEFARALIKLKEGCPWFKRCLKRMDISNIGIIHEVTPFMKF